MNNFPAFLRQKSKPTSEVLSNIHIASPCPADWNKMTGDERVRHCSECNLNVYNLSAMTEREAASLIAAHEGKRLCGRFYRRADGTVLTQDCPWGLRALKRRASRFAGAVLSALMSVGLAPAKSMPQSSSLSRTQNTAQEPGVAIRVDDPTGALIPGAAVQLINQKTGEIITAKTGDQGEIVLSPPSSGDYQLTITRTGFRTFSRTMNLSENRLERLNATLQLSATSGVVIEPQAPYVQPEIAEQSTLLPVLIQSQPQASGVALQVVDTIGAVVPNAEISVTSMKGKKKKIHVRTNDLGMALVSPLPGGDYRLTVSARWFRKYSQTISVSEGKVEDVNVTLTPLDKTVTIVVGMVD